MNSFSDPAANENGNPKSGRPKMVRSQLLGRHSHETQNGVNIQIWQRGDSLLARGYYDGPQFGETLGADLRLAESRLRQMMNEIENETYVVPSQRSKQALAPQGRAKLSLRELCKAFLAEKQRTCGKNTMKDYRARLMPLVEFSELPAVRKRWPFANDVDHAFALEFRTFINSRQVAKNGRAASKPRLISQRQAYNVRDTARSLYNWATSVKISKLPASLIHPFDAGFVGQRPAKDPLRSPPFPQDERIKLVSLMDEWQLTHLALSMVLPLRPEDCSGLLIRDVDFDKRWLSFGSRFGGRDFNKGRVSYFVPFPVELEPILRFCIGTREDGPLFRRRSVFEGRSQPNVMCVSIGDVDRLVEHRFGTAEKSEVQTQQDQKSVFRELLKTIGGVSTDDLSREFKKLLNQGNFGNTLRYYDLRHSITTELDRAGVSHLILNYVTGHTLRDILFEYVSLDPVGEMSKYFATIKPLLNSLRSRAGELGLLF